MPSSTSSAARCPVILFSAAASNVPAVSSSVLMPPILANLGPAL